MNQRIRQLAEQCRFEIQGINCEVLGQGFDEEKFAELIVQECVRVVDDTLTENQEMNIGLVMASAAIVSHFGVEE